MEGIFSIDVPFGFALAIAVVAGIIPGPRSSSTCGGKSASSSTAPGVVA
jgi:hypothetical protein